MLPFLNTSHRRPSDKQMIMFYCFSKQVETGWGIPESLLLMLFISFIMLFYSNTKLLGSYRSLVCNVQFCPLKLLFPIRLSPHAQICSTDAEIAFRKQDFLSFISVLGAIFIQHVTSFWHNEVDNTIKANAIKPT